LRHRLALFRETGRVFRLPSKLFAENSWFQVMLGQGIEPQGKRSRNYRRKAYVEQYCKAHSE